MRAWPRNPVVYEIDTWVWLGGPKGLATARGMLTGRGLLLILDFVQGTADDARRDPACTSTRGHGNATCSGWLRREDDSPMRKVAR